MILYITGVPGHGKTLRAMWWLQQKEFAERPIYSNIEAETQTGLPAGHSALPTDWRDVPQGSVIVIDEVQHRWPQRGPSKPVPDEISALDTHRHHGIDFVLLTQRPTGVDHHVRGLVGRHEHLRRKAGAEAAIIHRKDEAFDPKDKRELYEADSELWRYPKDLYGQYKSSIEHTGAYRFRLPAKAKFFGGLLLLLAVGAGYAVTTTLSGFGAEKTPVEQGDDLTSPETTPTTRDRIKAAGPTGPEQGCKMQGPPYGCRSPNVWGEAGSGEIVGCFHKDDTCVCFVRGSARPQRNYTQCLNWLAAN